MRTSHRIHRHTPNLESLWLIAMFVLMLISAVAISLVISSGTESSLAGNYRTTLSAKFAATAGIEEARGRLVPGNPPHRASLGWSASLPTRNQVVTSRTRRLENCRRRPYGDLPRREFDTEFTRRSRRSNQRPMSTPFGRSSNDADCAGRWKDPFESLP